MFLHFTRLFNHLRVIGERKGVGEWRASSAFLIVQRTDWKNQEAAVPHHNVNILKGNKLIKLLFFRFSSCSSSECSRVFGVMEFFLVQIFHFSTAIIINIIGRLDNNNKSWFNEKKRRKNVVQVFVEGKNKRRGKHYVIESCSKVFLAFFTKKEIFPRWNL